MLCSLNDLFPITDIPSRTDLPPALTIFEIFSTLPLAAVTRAIESLTAVSHSRVKRVQLGSADSRETGK